MNTLMSPGQAKLSGQAIFNPQRMEIARKRRMLTRRELALRIGVRPRTMERWCAVLSEPKPENIKALAKVLRWPKGFFFGDDIGEPDAATTSFRNLTGLPVSPPNESSNDS